MSRYTFPQMTCFLALLLLIFSPSVSAQVTYVDQWGSPGTGTDQFQDARWITVDGSGNVWVVDQGANLFKKFDGDGDFIVQIGTPSSEDAEGIDFDAAGNLWHVDEVGNLFKLDPTEGTVIGSYDGTAGSGAPFIFQNPLGVLTDPQGFIYVSDKTAGKVAGFDGSFLFELQFGQQGDGNGQFNNPRGMALDSERKIIIADQSNHRIQKMDNGGTFFGAVGSQGSGDDQFNTPYDVAVDGNDNIYVADIGNNRVQVFDSDLNFIESIGTQGNGNGEFNGPIALDVYSNFLYVVDNLNARVQKFDITNVGTGSGGGGGSQSGITFVGTWGSVGDDNGQFSSPRSLAADGNGDIWVVDTDNRRFQVFDTNGGFKAAYPAPGNEPEGLAFATFQNTMWHTDKDNDLLYRIDASNGAVLGTHADGLFVGASRISIEQNTFVNVSDFNGHTVRQFDFSGNPEGNIGSFGQGSPGQFVAPAGMVLDSGNHLFIVDQGNQRLQRRDRNTGAFTASSAAMTQPIDVSIDGNDNLYVLDKSAAKIHVLDNDLNLIDSFGSFGTGDGQFNSPEGILILGDFAFVSDRGNNRIVKLDITGVGGGGSGSGSSSGIAFADEWGSPGSGNGQFASPRAMTVDGNGDLWVVDRDNDRFQVFGPDGSFKAAYASPGTNPHGIAYTTIQNSIWHTDRTTKLLYRIDASNGTEQSSHAAGVFSTPSRIAIQGGSFIHVGDQGSFQVRQFDFGGNPEGQFGGFGSDPGQFGQLSPGGMAMDSNNNLIITDFGQGRVQKQNRNTGAFTTGAVSQAVDAAVDGNDRIFIVSSTHQVHVLDSDLNILESFGEQGSGDGQFSSPEGIAVIGNFAYVSDTGNNRIVKLDITNAGSGGGGGGGGDPPAISISDVTGDEDQTPFNFDVTLSAASSQTVTVDYVSNIVIARDEVAGGGTPGNPGPATDFIKVTGTLTFNPGETQKSIPVTIIDDTIEEGDETFTVDLSNPTNATIADGQGTGTIQDNDTPAPSLSIDDVSGPENVQFMVFTVTLTGTITQAVTVDYVTQNDTAIDEGGGGNDYNLTQGTLTFNPGDTEKTISVEIFDDGADEGNEQFFMNLSNVTGEAVIGDAQGVGTILDDDGTQSALSIDDVTAGEDTSPFNFTVTLTPAASQTVTVDYATDNKTALAGSDYNTESGTLTFNPGETQKTISVTIIDDADVEPSELFHVNLSNATNAAISDTQGDGTIQDNDVAPPAAKLTFEDAFGAPGGQAVVNVVLEGTNEVVGLQFNVDPKINGTDAGQTAAFLGGINALDNDFSLNAATTEANPRVLFFSNSNSAIQMGGNDQRLILQLVYNLDGNIQPGTEIDLDITDDILSDSNSQPIEHQLMSGRIRIGQPGDIAGGGQGGGGDGEINILDIVAGIQTILGITPAPQPGTLAHFSLDMNGDGDLNVLDIVAMINAALNQGGTAKAVAAIPAQTASLQLGDAITLDNGQLAVPVRLDADGAVAAMEAAFSFDPHLLTLGAPYLDESTAHMTLDTHIEDGTLRVVVYSITGGQIPSDTQVMLWMPVALGDDTRGAAVLNMDETILADRLAQAVTVVSPSSSVSIRPAPTAFSLQPNRPNPFNPSTAISYEVSQRTHVTLSIYNVLGQEIIRLVDKVQPAGRYTINWDARTAHGHPVASGIYLYRLNTGSGFSQTMRMTLLK